MGDRIKEFVTRDFTTEEMVNFFIYLTITIMPFIVVKKYSPHYVVGKVIFLYVIGAILLFILLKEKVFKFKNISLESKIALIFFVGLTLSTVFGVAKKTALLGNDERYEGLLVYGIYLLLFLGAMKYIKINFNMIFTVIISAVTMAIYTLIQLLGIDLIYFWIKNKTVGFETFGLIGHRNFLSTYFIIMLFLSLGVYIFYNKKSYFIYSCVIFAGLIATFTRSGWFSLVIGCIIGLILIFKDKEKLKKVPLIIIAFLMIFLSLNFVTSGQVNKRGKSIVEDGVNLSEKSGSFRILIWNLTMKSIKENPLIGSGADTLHHKLDKYCNKDYNIFKDGHNVIIDKAHNEFLEYWACGGLLTLISYLVLIGVILKNLIKNFEDDRSKILFLIIVGYLIQSFFNISVIQVAPIYWIVLGAAVKSYKIEGLVTQNFKSYFFLK